MEALGPKHGHIWMCLCRPALIIFPILTPGDNSYSKYRTLSLSYTRHIRTICLWIWSYDSACIAETQMQSVPFQIYSTTMNNMKMYRNPWMHACDLFNATRPRVVCQLVRSSIAISTTPLWQKAVSDQIQNFPNPLEMTLSKMPETPHLHWTIIPPSYPPFMH